MAKNAPGSAVPKILITPSIRSRLPPAVRSPDPTRLTSTVVAPVAFPEIVSVSEPPPTRAKLASSTTVPPPVKLPGTVSASVTSLSSPTLSVPVTSSDPAETVWAPVPKAILEPSPISTVSHPLRLAPAIAPETPLNASVLSVLAPAAINAPTPETLAPLKVSLSESSASLMSPLSAAPLSITTLSQPFSP